MIRAFVSAQIRATGGAVHQCIWRSVALSVRCVLRAAGTRREGRRDVG
ncbi:hypothetical protein EV663_10387 [Rhodovulum bhavnagarense]|uniref:Uncharacterized protein n=1 Tax=Rhodovulum bhavnagarense TaxID=992286 RepID=A0A4R2REH2_9RHOB|nr:hypothetical protein EV663_10387 [Rhodovulum bhavnagarense]